MKINSLLIKRGNPKILSLTFEEEGWAEADGRRGAGDQLWGFISRAARFQIPALPLTLGRTGLLCASVSSFIRWG